MGFHHTTLRNPSISAGLVKARSYLQACSQRPIWKPASCVVSHRVTTTRWTKIGIQYIVYCIPTFGPPGTSTSRPYLNFRQPSLCNIIRSEALRLQASHAIVLSDRHSCRCIRRSNTATLFLMEIKGKGRPETCHQGREEQQRYISTLSLTSSLLDESGWSAPRPY